MMLSAGRRCGAFRSRFFSRTPTESATSGPSSITDGIPRRWSAAGDSKRSEPAVHDQALAADIVAVGAAEEVDRARGLSRQAAAAERDHLVHGGDTAALHADLDLADLDLDLAVFALCQRLGEAGLDVAEGDGVDRDVVAAELLGQRFRQADDAGLAGRVVRLAGIAVDARGRGDVDDLAHDALAGRA